MYLRRDQINHKIIRFRKFSNAKTVFKFNFPYFIQIPNPPQSITLHAVLKEKLRKNKFKKILKIQFAHFRFPDEEKKN